MGRHHVLKPHHLYLSSPSHSPTPFHNLKHSYSSPYLLFQSSTPSTFAVRDRIPGFKISAAFLSSLHSNIFTELDSNFDSPEQTPYTLQPTVVDLPPLPIAESMPPLTDADGGLPDALELPENATEDDEAASNHRDATAGDNNTPALSTILAEDNDAKAEALHIIADSIAQQRDMGFRALVFHPLSAASLLATFAVLLHIGTNNGVTNWPLVGFTFLGVIMISLGAIRLILGPYIFEAERVGTWSWLNQGRSADEQQEADSHVLGEVDEILLTKFGDEFIGAVIFRGVQPARIPSSPIGGKKTRRAQSPSKHTRMVIRAWSVVQKYRRKGVGAMLLGNAIKVGKGKGWTVNGVEFANDHANHKRVLPTVFNGAMDTYEKIANDTLDKKVRELGAVQGKGRRKK